jgi:hypothetical protein
MACDRQNSIVVDINSFVATRTDNLWCEILEIGRSLTGRLRELTMTLQSTVGLG